jgi:hypothetical protein
LAGLYIPPRPMSNKHFKVRRLNPRQLAFWSAIPIFLFLLAVRNRFKLK